MTVKPFYAVAYSTTRTSIPWNVLSLPVIPEEIEQQPTKISVSDGDQPSLGSRLPTRSTSGLERQDSFELRFPDSVFSFPRPPPSAREGVSSPTPSMMSTSSSSSTSSVFPATPTASDDEFCLAPAPKKILRRTTAFRKLGEHSPESDDSDSEWYANELGKMLTLYSAPSSTEPTSSSLETLPPSPAYHTKALPSPSMELDPSFPRRRSKPRRRHTVSDRAPPPPVPPIPAHFRSLSASLTPNSTRRHTRPPPRSSLPSDADDEDDLLSYYTSPLTPPFSREPISPILEVVEENGETNILVLDVDLESGLQLPVSLPASPLPPGELENDLGISAVLNSAPSQVIDDAPFVESPELRSRWSTSTLGSIYDQQATSPVTKLWFQITGSPTKTRQSPPLKKSASPPRSISPPKEKKVRVDESPRRPLRTPPSPRPQSPPRVLSTGIRRRASTNSTSSSSSRATSASSSAQSGMSTRSSSSNGLRRKPIPVEMFLRV